MAKGNRLINATFFGITLVFLYFLKAYISKIDFQFLHLPNLLLALPTLFFILFASLLMPMLKRSAQTFYSVLVFIVGILVSAYSYQGDLNALLSYSFFFFIALISSVFLCSTQLRKFKFRVAIYGSLFFSLLFLVCYFNLKGWRWLYLRSPIFYFSFVIAYMNANINFSRNNFLRMTFSPAHLILPINFPVEDESFYGKDDYEIWTDGVLQIYKAFIFILLTYLITRISSDALVITSFINYLTYLLLAPAVANFVTGTAKTFFLNVPDCANHLWLSGSPLDFLKRENAHAYSFSIRFVYFNLLKITRNPFFIVFIYCLLFPFYRNSLDIIAHLKSMSLEIFGKRLLLGYFFWFLLFFSIIATFKIPYFNRQKYGWKAVAANHLLMYLLFYVFSSFYRM